MALDKDMLALNERDLDLLDADCYSVAERFRVAWENEDIRRAMQGSLSIRALLCIEAVRENLSRRGD